MPRRSARGECVTPPGSPRLPEAGTPDPEIGDNLPGWGPAESAIGLFAPMHVYPLLESVVAAREGRDAPTHRLAMGRLFAPFSEVAATNPYAWFPQAWSPEEIATPSPENRIVCEPYTKRMSAFLGSDQGAALLVCSLAAAQRAGLADRAIFVWAGAEATDVRAPSARPDLGRSAGIAAAGEALFEAARVAAESPVGVDDLELLDLYSCFPSAVELAGDALGIATDDPRGLTVTGGLPYFGGPGNNYTTHSIAALTERLRRSDDGLGLATGLGWYVTKHALGLYGRKRPPGGFRRGDTEKAQAAIDASCGRGRSRCRGGDRRTHRRGHRGARFARGSERGTDDRGPSGRPADGGGGRRRRDGRRRSARSMCRDWSAVTWSCSRAPRATVWRHRDLPGGPQCPTCSVNARATPRS